MKVQILRLCLGAVGLSLAWNAAGQAFPLQLRSTDVHFNYQSFQGVPISSSVNTNTGSNGRQPTGINGSGTFEAATVRQFQSFIAFGAVAGSTNRPAPPNYTATNSHETNFVLHLAMVGGPYMGRATSLRFGEPIYPPTTDEQGRQVADGYWQPVPYLDATAPNAESYTTNTGFYYSPHAGVTYATQPGPITVTWIGSKAYATTNFPNDWVNAGWPGGPNRLKMSDQSVYLLYTVRYVVSAEPVKRTRTIYWTEGEFSKLGKLISIPAGLAPGGVEIVYNNQMPQRVSEAEAYPAPDSDPSLAMTNNRLRTIYYDYTDGFLHAYNKQGMVFMELLGDAKGDGTYEQLGIEIVNVRQDPVPVDATNYLGELITPPTASSYPPEGLLRLEPEQVIQDVSKYFAYQRNVSGSGRIELYATRETFTLNDYKIHWMEKGELDIKWPAIFGRHALKWPADVARYSHYIRPPAATEADAIQTAVQLPMESSPSVEYQDALDRPRAKITVENKYYTWLDLAHPAHRALIRYINGEGIAFERVFSWLDAGLRTNSIFNGTVPVAQLSVWNTNGSITWPTNSDLVRPRLMSGMVDVGKPILPPPGGNRPRWQLRRGPYQSDCRHALQCQCLQGPDGHSHDQRQHRRHYSHQCDPRKERAGGLVDANQHDQRRLQRGGRYQRLQACLLAFSDRSLHKPVACGRPGTRAGEPGSHPQSGKLGGCGIDLRPEHKHPGRLQPQRRTWAADCQPCVRPSRRPEPYRYGGSPQLHLRTLRAG